MKKCANCKDIKDEKEFGKDKYAKDGFTHSCKLCRKNSYDRYVENNPEKIKEKNKAQREKNKERIKTYTKEYSNRPEIKERRKIYNKNLVSDPEFKKRKNSLRKEKYKNDLRYKTHCLMSTRMKRSISDHNFNKNGLSIEKILGYDMLFLIKHLESKFEEGMDWNNRGKGEGKWEIDHIIPDSWFNYQSVNDEGFKQSWDIENLQPMWSIENLKKHNKFAGTLNNRILKDEIMTTEGLRVENWKQIIQKKEQ